MADRIDMAQERHQLIADAQIKTPARSLAGLLHFTAKNAEHPSQSNAVA